MSRKVASSRRRPVGKEVDWISKLPADFRWLLSDVAWECVRAKMHGANRRKKSRPIWRRAIRLLDRLRTKCLAPAPKRREVRLLAKRVEELFDLATDRSRPPPEPPATSKKVTVLDGYYASGDYDSFVFDRCPDPRTHHDKWRKRYGHPLQGQYDAKPSERVKGCSVYPEALMPPDIDDRKGRWRITVEFWPDGLVKTQAEKTSVDVQVSPRVEVDSRSARAIRKIEKRALRRLLQPPGR